jgi:2-desacetyl-2-hydroxyethyl bacteriochlorophyllide A dehydrogenase
MNGEFYYPLVPGYENVGEVVHVGKNVTDVKVGERVMANECRYFPDYCAAWGGQVEYSVRNKTTATAPFDKYVKIPDRVSDEQACLATLAAVALKGIKRVEKITGISGKNVLITGMGCVGLSAAQLAHIYGAGRVVCMDRIEKRAESAARFCEFPLRAEDRDSNRKALNDLFDGRQPDIIFECSGNREIVSDLIYYIKDGGWEAHDNGHIHLQGDYPNPVVLQNYHGWMTKNLDISITCAPLPGCKEEVLEHMLAGRFKTDGMVTRVFPVDSIPDPYLQMNETYPEDLKYLINWNHQ